MKIGILTFSCAYNYGAALQCYALQEHLKLSGHEVSIINYRPNYLCEKTPKLTYRLFLSKSPVSFIKKCKVYIRKKIYYNLFKNFEDKYFQYTHPFNEQQKENIIDILKGLDYVIIGSDQVWNKKITGFDNIWLGAFNKSDTTKIITYAASAGTPYFNDKEKEYFFNQLKTFSKILVRENILKEYIQNNIKIPVSCVLDPTLMVSPSIWDTFNHKPQFKNYIIVHQARKDENTLRIARLISSQLNNATIISTDMYINSYNKFSKHIILPPDKFFSLVKNAKCVITSSFHVTAFSIINKIPFYTLKLFDNSDERSEHLLNELGLIDRFISKNDNPNFNLIDYSVALDRLNILRSKSQELLNDALQ